MAAEWGNRGVCGVCECAAVVPQQVGIVKLLADGLCHVRQTPVAVGSTC